ncbi:MAG: hypothetical protein AAGJ84_05530 [Pseudomonadota bacterium]
MARFQAKPREDGYGPYRWAHVVRSQQSFRLGSIYRQLGDDLTPDECRTLVQTCAREGFDLRRAR